MMGLKHNTNITSIIDIDCMDFVSIISSATTLLQKNFVQRVIQLKEMINSVTNLISSLILSCITLSISKSFVIKL